MGVREALEDIVLGPICFAYFVGENVVNNAKIVYYDSKGIPYEGYHKDFGWGVRRIDESNNS